MFVTSRRFARYPLTKLLVQNSWCAMSSDGGYLQLSRKELHALAKQYGVPANKTTAYLCDELARLDAGRENLRDQNAALSIKPAKPPGVKPCEGASRRHHPTLDDRADPAGDGQVAMGFLSLRRSSAPVKTNTQRKTVAPVKTVEAAAPSEAAAPAEAAVLAPLIDPTPTELCVALEQLLCNHAALFRGAAGTLLKVVSNLRLHPGDPAYRALRCGTNAFQATLAPARGAVACLIAVGFERTFHGDAGGRYALRDGADPGQLAGAAACTLHAPCMPTACTLHAHCVHTACTLRAYCMHHTHCVPTA